MGPKGRPAPPGRGRGCPFPSSERRRGRARRGADDTTSEPSIGRHHGDEHKHGRGAGSACYPPDAHSQRDRASGRAGANVTRSRARVEVGSTASGRALSWGRASGKNGDPRLRITTMGHRNGPAFLAHLSPRLHAHLRKTISIIIYRPLDDFAQRG